MELFKEILFGILGGSVLVGGGVALARVIMGEESWKWLLNEIKKTK